jgi:hypothetical protein
MRIDSLLDSSVVFNIQMVALILYVGCWIPVRVFVQSPKQRPILWMLWLGFGVMPFVLSIPHLVFQIRSVGVHNDHFQVQLMFLLVWAAGCYRIMPSRSSDGSAKPA